MRCDDSSDRWSIRKESNAVVKSNRKKCVCLCNEESSVFVVVVERTPYLLLRCDLPAISVVLSQNLHFLSLYTDLIDSFVSVSLVWFPQFPSSFFLVVCLLLLLWQHHIASDFFPSIKFSVYLSKSQKAKHKKNVES